MGVFHVFKIIQMLPDRTTHNICLKNGVYDSSESCKIFTLGETIKLGRYSLFLAFFLLNINVQIQRGKQRFI